MIARFGRRLFEASVALFALLGFAFVPLGQHTGLEHVRAIASTAAAERAARELLEAGVRLRQQLTRALVAGDDSKQKRDLPLLPAEPELGPEPVNARIAPSTETIDASAPWHPGT